MIRLRLRDLPDLATTYVTPHQHDKWAEHRARVDVCVAIAGHVLAPHSRVVDLSCGDATIARRLVGTHAARLTLGDYAPGYEITGPIEETVRHIDRADLFICCETLEHLDDPDSVLKLIRERTDKVLISTPDGETDAANPEHVWGWDSDAVRAMLVQAGWVPQVYNLLDLRPAGGNYAYQIWVAK